jgi:hypothetical protein
MSDTEPDFALGVCSDETKQPDTPSFGTELPDQSDGTHADIPDKNWTTPFPNGHPLHDLYSRRIRNGQDLVIIVDDYHSRRGTGKTIASLQMAEGMDQNGGLTKANVTIEPQELRNKYSELPKRSALVLDEGEIGASNREAMTVVNRALREIVSIGRVEEKYVIINTPDKGFIDKDIRKMADVWMTMLAKGIGLIHYLKRNPYARGGDGQLLNENNGLVQFRDVERGTRLREVYNYLTKEKKKHIDGEGGKELIPRPKHEEELQKARENARQEERNEIITDVYNRLTGLDEDDFTRMKRANGVSQSMLGEAVGLTQQQIGNIVRGD